MEGFLHYWFRGLIFGGAYKWRGLFFYFHSICNIGLTLWDTVSITQHNMLYSLTRICHITSLPPHKRPPLHYCHFLLSPRQAIWHYAIVRFCTIDLKLHPIAQFEEIHIIRKKYKQSNNFPILMLFKVIYQ